MGLTKLLNICLVAVLVAGCAATKPVQAPIPGQVNAFDASTYRGLRDMQAAIDATNTDTKNGTVVFTAQETQIFMAFKGAYNAAEAAWQVYHAAATTANANALTAAYNSANTAYGQFVTARTPPAAAAPAAATPATTNK